MTRETGARDDRAKPDLEALDSRNDADVQSAGYEGDHADLRSRWDTCLGQRCAWRVFLLFF